MRKLALPILALSIASGCASDPPPPPAGPTSVTVLYEVEGTAKWAAVTMQTPDGSTQINPDVPMVRKGGKKGLEYTFTPGSFVYISAQNNDSRGTVSCRITVDGKTVSENQASGGYAIATCQGTA